MTIISFDFFFESIGVFSRVVGRMDAQKACWIEMVVLLVCFSNNEFSYFSKKILNILWEPFPLLFFLGQLAPYHMWLAFWTLRK